MVQGILFLLAGFLLALAVMMGQSELRGRMASWKSLAGRLGLRSWSGEMGISPGIEGTYQDRPVRVQLVPYVVGGAERVYTRVETTCRNPKSISIALCNRSGRVVRTEGDGFGLPAVDTGNARLEKVFEVHASEAGAAKKLLDAKLIERLVWEERIRFVVDGHRVVVDVRDAIDDEEHVRLLLDLVTMAAARADGL